jgi:uncharacterized protein YdhG (YjbR/CyaY superfamily)
MNVIDDYLERFEPPVRTELERIRSVAKRILPDSEETITYRMPTIKYKGKSIIGFDARKNHIGIYPFSSQVISETDELKDYETSRGAIREKLDKLLPDPLLEKIIRERMKQAGV